jgi:hypothetical protein
VGKDFTGIPRLHTRIPLQAWDDWLSRSDTALGSGARVEYEHFYFMLALVHRSQFERIAVFDAVSMRWLPRTGRISGVRMPAFD